MESGQLKTIAQVLGDIGRILVDRVVHQKGHAVG